MPSGNDSDRRGFMKMLAASPLLAQIAAQGLYEKSAAAIGVDIRGNVYSLQLSGNATNQAQLTPDHRERAMFRLLQLL
jgi:hypothetical protein